MLKKYLIENIIFTVKLIFQGGKELQLVKVSYKSEKLVSHSIAGKLTWKAQITASRIA